MSSSRFSRSIAALFRPPFEGLWLAVILYFALCFIVYPHSPILRGDLPDDDDYMYLAQLHDLLNGQGWYDNIQHRLDPPLGVPIHFSRLAMLPMAFLTIAFETFGLPAHGAMTLMAAVWPLILLGFFFITLRWTAENLMPPTWAGVTAFIGLFGADSMFFFAPGHIDHHGLIVLLVIATLGCVMRMMRGEEDVRWGIYAGLTLALALTIALEVLPWLLVTSALLGLRGITIGGKAARNGFAYGAALYLGCVVGLLVTRPLSGIFIEDELSYSVVYVVLAGLIAICLAGVAILAKRRLWVRAAVGIALALLSGGAFLFSFPALITGPYGAMDPHLAPIMMEGISETWPLLGGDHGGWVTFFAWAARAVVAFLVGFAFMKQAGKDERWCWRFLMTLLAAAFVLTVFCQRRFAGVMDTLAAIPLSVLLWRGWLWAGQREGRAKVCARIGLLLITGPLPLLLAPVLRNGWSFGTGVLLFPALEPEQSCDMHALENILRDPAFYGDRPRLIINPMNIGAELLFRTPHDVLSAPFHMDVAGNLDATHFFTTTDPAEAEAIARRRHADLVVVCYSVPKVYLYPPGEPAEMIGKSRFITQLLSGHAPPWIKNVQFKGLDNFAVYEVLSAVAPKPEKPHAP